MATKVVVPQLGESVVEATVGNWLKQEGEQVAVGDVLVELQTDKVDVEVGAETAGVLVKIERQQGEDVEIGDVLGLIEEDGSAASTNGQGTKSVAQPPTERKAPAGTEPQAAPEPEAETAPEPEQATESAPSPARAADGDRVTPVARRMAEEQGVDTSQVSGSGPGGRVTKQDVEDFLKGREQKAAAAPPPQTETAPATRERAAAPTPDTLDPAMPGPGPRREERERMSRRRRTIAERLVEAQQTAAMLTTFNEIDMSAVISLRKRRQEDFVERHGIKLGFMSFFVKASIGALKAFPHLNAEIQGDEMVLKHYYDIGMAVGVEEGLVVPVIRDADRKSFAEIEKSIQEMAQKAQDGKLSLEDLRGGTFTITNGGVFGSMLSTPILNPPQVGILGLHRIQERPVVVDGEVKVRPIMYVALSYDHRIVDGREAVLFLVRIKELIEDPETLLLEG